MAIDYQYFEFRAFECLLKLGQLWEADAAVPGIGRLLAQIREEQELIRTRKFRVAVVGEFNRGKTSFINALLGREILPVDVFPTTATPNRITYGTVPRAYLKYKDGRTEDVEIGELSRYVTKLTEQSENAAAGIEEAVVEYPSIFCQNHVDLIDTPGMNDDISMNDVTLRQLEHIDLAIVTLSPGSPFSETESRFMARLLESDEICRIMIVVTKIDQVRGEEKRRQLLSYLAGQVPRKTLEILRESHHEQEAVFEKFRELFQDLPLFGVCSLDALEARQRGDEELFRKSGFAQLNDQLPQIILTSQKNNTVLRAICTIRRITEEYREQLPALRAACESAREEIRRERKQFAENCYNLADVRMLDSLKRTLWEKTDAFSAVQEELTKDFIRCLSNVRVLDAGVIDEALKAQAVTGADQINRRIGQELLPELQKLLDRELAVWYQRILDQIASGAWLEKKEMGRVRELAGKLKAGIPFSTKLSDNVFFWKPFPVPGKEQLLKPDLIVYIRKAVEASVQAWCTDRKRKIEKILTQASAQLMKELEQLVVALFEASNRQIAGWEEAEERLNSPGLLEKLDQLAEENSRLEQEFMEHLRQ